MGTLRSSPLYPDIEKSRAIPSFDELLEMSNENLLSFGIESEEVRYKILTATTNWKNEHQLPGNFLYYNTFNFTFNS